MRFTDYDAMDAAMKSEREMIKQPFTRHITSGSCISFNHALLLVYANVAFLVTSPSREDTLCITVTLTSSMSHQDLFRCR